jgi:hypothetical protein
VTTGRGVRQGCCSSLILFNVHSEYPTKGSLEQFGDFKHNPVICTAKYAYDLVLLAKEEMVRSQLIRRTETGRCYRTETNVEKTKMKYLNHLGGIITNNVRCICEIKSRISITKAAFNRKKVLFTSKLDLNLRKELVSAIFRAQLCTVLKLGHF